MVAKVSKSSVSSKVAFFMKEQEKEKKNAISAKLAFFQAKTCGTSPRKRVKCGKSGIKSKLAIFQRKENEAAQILKKQRDVQLFFQERRQKTKAQTKQSNINSPTKFSIGSTVITTSNPIFTGTIINNIDNGIIPVKLKWATAFISKNNLKLAREKTTEVTKRKREDDKTNQPSSKKNKYDVKPQTKQNGSETIMESSITPSFTTHTPTSTPMKQKNEPTSSGLEVMDTDIVEPLKKDTKSPIEQLPASIPTPNVKPPTKQNEDELSRVQPPFPDATLVPPSSTVPDETPAPSSLKQNNIQSLPKENTEKKNTELSSTQDVPMEDSLTKNINEKETILKNESSTITQNNTVNLPVIA